MAYEATRTGAYQTAIKAADAVVTALIPQGMVSTEQALELHEKVRRAVYADIAPVVEKDIEDAKSRPQQRSGGGGRQGGGGGGQQSSIPTDGSTRFGQKQDDGSYKGGGAVAGLSIAEVAGLSAQDMEDRGVKTGNDGVAKTGLAYLKGLVEWEGYSNQYMKRRIKAYLDGLNGQATPAPAAEAPAEQPAGLDEDFAFPES